MPTDEALAEAPLTVEQREAQKLSPLEAGIISTGRGFKNIGEAVGLVDTDPAEKAIFGAVEEEFPVATEVGQAVGETAPFLLPGSALGAIPKLAPRALAATGLGVSEGAIISKGRGIIFLSFVLNFIASTFIIITPLFARTRLHSCHIANNSDRYTLYV